MGIATVVCPVCGDDVEIGIPKDADVKAVVTDPGDVTDSPTSKWRRQACANDHEFQINFER